LGGLLAVSALPPTHLKKDQGRHPFNGVETGQDNRVPRMILIEGRPFD
jgi:hypothetical protein